MAIHFGNDKIKEVYVGSDIIKGVYYGSEKVWGIDYPQDGYWVHKDTGVKTYFDAGADFITGRIMSSPSWMYDCSEVKLPSGVIGLGDNCFRDCSSLASITLPESLTSIGKSCFRDCTSLTSINIPESVTSIGGDCFRNCTSLNLVTVLPAIPPSLGFNVFLNTHPSLGILVRSSYVDDYKTATNWTDYASIIKDGYWVHRSTGVKTLIGLEDLSIIDGIMSPPSWGSSSSEVQIPSGVTGLGLGGLGMGCFMNCLYLTSITLPESVTSLANNSFNGCRSLASIILPESVTSLGLNCFRNCASLTLATVLPAIPPSLGGYAFMGVHSSFNIKVHSPYVNAYKTATNWTEYATKISAI